MTRHREQKSFEYVKYLWQDEVADQLSGLDRLVYRSNMLGEDLRSPTRAAATPPRSSRSTTR